MMTGKIKHSKTAPRPKFVGSKVKDTDPVQPKPVGKRIIVDGGKSKASSGAVLKKCLWQTTRGRIPDYWTQIIIEEEIGKKE